MRVQGQDLGRRDSRFPDGWQLWNRGVRRKTRQVALRAATEASLIVPAHVPEIPVEARLAHPLPPADLTI
jgi:hypothetical protein